MREGQVVYLIHFARPVGGHMRHFRGMTRNLDKVLAEFRAGRGNAPLMKFVHREGVPWVLARTWAGDRWKLNQLLQKGAGRSCPICHPMNEERMEK